MLAGFELDTHDFHEKMELCDVCGSFLVIGDSQCRVDAHLLGKQHMGYARIRSTITELRVSVSIVVCLAQSMTDFDMEHMQHKPNHLSCDTCLLFIVQ